MQSRLRLLQFLVLIGILSATVSPLVAQDAELVRHFDYDIRLPIGLKEIVAVTSPSTTSLMLKIRTGSARGPRRGSRAGVVVATGSRDPIAPSKKVVEP